MISVLRDNLAAKEDEQVNRFIKGLLHWISRQIEYSCAPFEEKHKEEIVKIFAAYSHKLDDTSFL